MAKKYYTLAVLQDGRWSPEFGDYDKEVVRDEAAEYRERGERVCIVTSGDTQADIDATVAKFNA